MPAIPRPQVIRRQPRDQFGVGEVSEDLGDGPGFLTAARRRRRTECRRSLCGRSLRRPDGKTRTVTLTGTDSKGKKYTSTAVYDKQ
jgi:hypothetical protein